MHHRSIKRQREKCNQNLVIRTLNGSADRSLTLQCRTTVLDSAGLSTFTGGKLKAKYTDSLIHLTFVPSLLPYVSSLALALGRYPASREEDQDHSKKKLSQEGDFSGFNSQEIDIKDEVVNQVNDTILSIIL